MEEQHAADIFPVLTTSKLGLLKEEWLEGGWARLFGRSEFRVIVRKVNRLLCLISALGRITFPPTHPNIFILRPLAHIQQLRRHTRSLGFHIGSVDFLLFFVIPLGSVLSEKYTPYEARNLYHGQMLFLSRGNVVN
jgi:hypothetical protein